MRTILVLACVSILVACNKPAEPKVEASASANFLSEQKKQLDQVIEVNTGGGAKKPAKKAGE